MRERAGFRLSAIVLLSGMALAGCGQNQRHPNASAPEVAANFAIKNSFRPAKDSKTGAPVVAIRKEALEKEFLLQGSLIQQPVAAMGSGLKSRIVAFKLRGKQILMLEATAGHTVTEAFPQNLILAAFPVLSETSTEVQFDFNKGMGTIFVNGDWTGHDLAGRDYSPSSSFVDVRLSYLESVDTLASNKLAIRQVAQVVQSGFLSGASLVPVELRYYLSPYDPNPDYVPAGPADFKRAGFFEIAPQLNLDGGTTIRSTKVHHTQPFVFTVSSNTPSDFKQAVHDGILYWKSVLPNIEVVDGPEGVSAPDPNHNIIQWVDHDSAGMAYADAQMDPRTGEVIHAQAFITSAFAFIGKRRMGALLRYMKQPQTPQAAGIALSGFEAKPLCKLEFTSEMEHSLRALQATGANDTQILRVAQDYVRAVVAHEVGHIIGLRHNFAGSLEVKNYSLDERESVFRNYVLTDQVPADIETSSTQMDYLPLEEAALHGYQMRTRPGLMYPYDRLAVEMLYFGKEPKRSEIPVFCTDTQVNEYADCRRHDFGPSLVQHASWRYRKNLDQIAHQVLETYLTAKAPAPWEQATAIESVHFNQVSLGDSLFAPVREVLDLMGSKKRLLQVVRNFPFIGPLNIEQVKEQEKAQIEKDLSSLGGLEAAFPLLRARDYDRVFDAIADQLESGPYANSFSPEEKETILETALSLAIALREAGSKADVESLAKISMHWKQSDADLGTQTAVWLEKRAREYTLAATGEPLEVNVTIASDPKDKAKDEDSEKDKQETTEDLTLSLTRFVYPSETRQKAPTLLKATESLDTLGWGEIQRKQLKKEFETLLDEACGCKFSTLVPAKIVAEDAKAQREARKWVFENKKVLAAF